MTIDAPVVIIYIQLKKRSERRNMPGSLREDAGGASIQTVHVVELSATTVKEEWTFIVK